jgi:hypothetical protein
MRTTVVLEKKDRLGTLSARARCEGVIDICILSKYVTRSLWVNDDI